MDGLSDDPVIPFRVSHAAALVAIKQRVDDLSSWAKIGVGGGITLLGAILAVLVMR